jgi:hypothetical protein
MRHAMRHDGRRRARFDICGAAGRAGMKVHLEFDPDVKTSMRSDQRVVRTKPPGSRDAAS